MTHERVPLGYIREILDANDEFAFETHGKRRGIAKVLTVDVSIPSHPYHVQWEDAAGKHLEWFALEDFKQLIRL